MSSSCLSHCSSNDRLLDGVEVYDGWFENSGWLRHGDEGADEGSDEEGRLSYLTSTYFDLRVGEGGLE